MKTKNSRFAGVSFVWLLVLLMAALPLSAQPESEQRGVKPDKLHQFHGLDNVNLFNGNLNIRIPIGGSYPNGGGSAFGLALQYNSKAWDYEDAAYWGLEVPEIDRGPYPRPYPTYSLVGFGWSLSLGRLIDPADPVNDKQIGTEVKHGCEPVWGATQTTCLPTEWRYIGSDGADYEFSQIYSKEAIADPSAKNDGTYYSQMNGHLRMRKVSSTEMAIDFPDGSIHTFKKPNAAQPYWQVETITDVHGNAFKISYEEGATGRPFKVQDQWDHVIALIGYSYIPPAADPEKRSYEWVIDWIKLRAPGQAGTADPSLHYEFEYYPPVEIARGGDWIYDPEWRTVYVSLLKKVTLPAVSGAPETSFSFDYYTETNPELNRRQQGLLKHMIVPTGGKTVWTWGGFTFNQAWCARGNTTSAAVKTRESFDGTTSLGVWKYTQDAGIDHERILECELGQCPTSSPQPRLCRPPQANTETTTFVESPTGIRTTHYFAVSPDNECFWESACLDQTGVPTGYPGSTYQPPIYLDAAQTKPMYLASRIWSNQAKTQGTPCDLTDDSTATETCLPARETYFAYEAHFWEGETTAPYTPGGSGNGWYDRYAERTIFSLDGGVYTQSVRTDWDGYGHYRTETVSDTFDGAAATRKVTTTRYNDGVTDQFGMVGSELRFRHATSERAADKWILNTADSSRVQGTTANDKFISYACYDRDSDGRPTSPLMKLSRTHRRMSASDTFPDAIVRNTYDTQGNLTSVEHGFADYAVDGTDADDLADAPCTLSGDVFHYKTGYGYTRGVRSSSKYLVPGEATTFLELSSSVIDDATGVVESITDAYGVTTDLIYDTIGRLEKEKTICSGRGTGGCNPGVTKYIYKEFNGTTPASLKTQRLTADEATIRAESEAIFDGFGRVVTENKKHPRASTVQRTTTYDAEGRVKTVSGWGTGITNTTSTDYDRHGRPTRITAPDGSVSNITYINDGVRQITKDVQVGADPSKRSSVTEFYDSLGRMTSITEAISASESLTAKYKYDAADRLLEVRLGPEPNPQIRTFNYDGAGWLISEDHPETAQTNFSGYDARGHAKYRQTAGLGQIEMIYDAAERLREVKDHSATPARTLQKFEYDNSSVPGKLVSSLRRNYFVDNENPYDVTTSFTYDQLGRAATKSTAITDRVNHTSTFTQTLTYRDDNLPDKIHYPVCASCGTASRTRVIDLSYDAGFLTNVANYTTSDSNGDDGITYWPSGMVRKVTHASPTNQPTVRDVYDTDEVVALPRPKSIEFQATKACDLIATQPVDDDVVYNETATFTVGLKEAGTTVQWYEGLSGDTTNLIAGATQSTLTVPNVTADRHFWARLRSADGGCISDSNTANARLCKGIVVTKPAQPVSTNPVPVDAGTKLTLEVEAKAESIAYVWQLVSGTSITDIGLGPKLIDYIVPAWPVEPTLRIIQVKLVSGGECATELIVPMKYLVKPVCTTDPPTFWASFPESMPIYQGGSSIALRVKMEPNLAADQKFVYRWSVNGNPWGPDSATTSNESEFTISAATFSFVEVEVWRECATEPPSKSPSVRRSTMVYDASACFAPPLKVDQSRITHLSANRTFSALTPLPNVTFAWYAGEKGNTSGTVLSNTWQFTPPAGAGTYWVRVTAPCGLYTDSDTLIVATETCNPVRFNQEPIGADGIPAGAAVNLSTDVSAGSNPTYQWFAGTTLIAETRTHLVRPIRTTSYYVRVGNGCTFANSRKALVRVSSCGDIKVNSQPASVNVDDGTSVTLSINAEPVGGGALFFQWYKGVSGDTSNPIANELAASYTFQATESGKYWVRVHFNDENRCAIDSDTVTVFVCKAPVITDNVPDDVVSSVPGLEHWLAASVTGDNMTIQWYRGEKPDTSTPVGAGPFVRVAPLVTTKYWVKATSDCPSPLNDRSDDDQTRISVCPQYLHAPGENTSEPPSQRPVATPAKVMPGATSRLEIFIEGGDLTYQWYKGPRGNTLVENKIDGATSAVLITPPITAETSFWVVVKSGVCERMSEAVTVAICNEPTISWSSGSDKVRSGQSQILGVTVAPEAASVTYYRGEVGDTTDIVSGPTANRGVNVAPEVTTKYWARARLESPGLTCTADSQAYTVTVCVPTITTQPPASLLLDKTQNPNATVALSVVANGGTLTYQWYIGDPGVTSNPVSGGTTATINVSPNTETKYWVRVSGSCGFSEDSTAVIVSLCQAPAITVQPVSKTTTANTMTSLDVTATGTNLTYAWYRGVSGDTTNPVGTNASLSTSVTATTPFWVRVSGTCGSVNSNTAYLSIAPTISTQPVDHNTTTGTSATFSVVASGNSLSYQWFNSPANTPIAGATSASYTTPALTADAAYYVVVSSGTASVQSNVVTARICVAKNITVTQPSTSAGTTVTLSIANPDPNQTYTWYRGTIPDTTNSLGTGTSKAVNPDVTTTYWALNAGYGCTSGRQVTVTVCAPRITTQPAGGTITAGETLHLTVAAVGNAPLTYQWYASGYAISGATASYYDASPTVDTNYQVRVTSGAGSSCYADTVVTTITVCRPPAITQQPLTVTANSGVPAQLSVTATGTNLSYQWYEGTPGTTTTPVGTNSAVLTVTSTVTRRYWVRVSNGCGTVDSAQGWVQVAPSITTQTQASPKYVTSGTPSTFSVVAGGTFLTYQWYVAPSTPISGATNTSYTTPNLTSNASLFCRVCSGSACVDSTTETAVICQPKGVTVSQPSTVAGSAVTLSIVQPDGNETYTWYQGPVGNTSTPLGTGTAKIVYPTTNTSYWVLNSGYGCTSNSAPVNISICQPRIDANPQSVFVNSGQQVSLTVAATGPAPLTYQWYEGNSGDMQYPVGGATSATLSFAAQSGTRNFWCRVTSAAGGSCVANSQHAQVRVCVPPSITSQPQNTIIYPTDTVTLSVGATGDELTYQWYEVVSGNNVALSGQTSNTLVIQPGTTRRFWVRVTGRCGVVDSATALQSVRPTITSQPANTTVCSGGTATFSVGATGSPDMQYRWFLGPVGSTSTYLGLASSVSVPNVTSTTSVWVQVSSGDAVVQSQLATATTQAGPTAYVSKTYLGGEYVFALNASVSADVAGYESYQWYRGPLSNTAASVAGAQSASTMVDVPSSTHFWVRVTDTRTGCHTDKGIMVPW